MQLVLDQYSYLVLTQLECAHLRQGFSNAVVYSDIAAYAHNATVKVVDMERVSFR